MNKDDLMNSLTKVLSTKKEAKDAIDKIIEEMKYALKKGDKVVLSGFGSFHPFTTKTKKCRNPRTGETIHISPRKKIRFHQSKDFF